jgi:glycosyltransferase involved in cell wall biosynthesis
MNLSVQRTSNQDRLATSRPLEGRKILIIVENLAVPFDRRVWNEARTLRDAGAEVAIICPTGAGCEEHYLELEGIHIYRHSLPIDASSARGYLLEYGAALFHEFRLALKVLRRHGFDTIHACNPPDLIFLVALPFKLFGKRFIFDHHDINPELYEAKFGRRDAYWRLMLLFERWTFRVADVVISTNQSYRDIALTRGNLAPEDVFVVRSGPALERLEMLAPNPEWRNGRKHLIGYVGVMGDQEGIDLLLEAMQILAHQYREDVQLVLVGGGPSLDALQVMAKRLNLSDHVTFTGRAPDNVLFEVLSTADVCVNPDRVNAMNDKSTMNKILEYMAFSRPIVQFDVTEGRYSAGGASLYARPNDPSDMADRLRELLNDPERAAKMGELGRQRIETMMSWDHQVDALVAAYKRVADKSRRRRWSLRASGRTAERVERVEKSGTKVSTSSSRRP